MGDTDKVTAERLHAPRRGRCGVRCARRAGQRNGRLTAYSFRHGYAYRSAMDYGLPVRVAANLMGQPRSAPEALRRSMGCGPVHRRSCSSQGSVETPLSDNAGGRFSRSASLRSRS